MIEDLERQIQSGCRFCNPVEKERILFETQNFYVMLSLGPIVEGYLLLVTKEHISCCGNMPLEYSDEFDELYCKIKQLQTELYGHSIAYEHGRAGVCLILTEGSKHCYHAHMHFLPVKAALDIEVSKDFDPISLDSLQDFRQQYNLANQGYLYVDSGNKNIYFIDEVIRRQYLRYKVAKMLDKEELWDWVNNQGWELIAAGKEKYSHFTNSPLA